jgi:DNA-binding NtrC family response regulator
MSDAVLLATIVIVDLEANACPAQGCDQLPRLLRTVFTGTAQDIQTMTQVPSGPLFPQPDLFFLRSSRTQPLAELVQCVRGGNFAALLVGLCCPSRETPATVWQSLCSGLDDFLCCPFTELDLIPRVHRLLQRRGLLPISQEPETRMALHLDGIVGESPAFLRILEQLPKVAGADATILLTGETGTGKEVVARAIHYHSPRHGQPFVPVNCGALPDHLLENELFGHAKGAFTDASSNEKGLLAEAEGGTLFLDEIDALSAAAQVKLLRVLQDREYRPLGSTKSRSANVRIITATNADLLRQVHAGRFREDLYYRLHLLCLRLPPLRERSEDIALLAHHFLLQYGQRHGRERLSFAPGAVRKLMAYPWPGNVRELEGVIQRAVILCAAPILQPENLELPTDAEQSAAPVNGSLRAAKSQVLGQFERGYLIDLLTAHEGNVTQAAKQAGKERRAFQRLLCKYGVDRREYQ